MPRKRLRSTSSGSSGHEVRQISSTQLDGDDIESELSASDQITKPRKGKCKKATTIPKLNQRALVSSHTGTLTKKTRRADTIAILSDKSSGSSNDIPQRRRPPVDPRLLEPSTSNDLNENAARSGMRNKRRERTSCRRRHKGRPRRTHSSDCTVLEVPVEPVLCTRSELTSEKNRKRRRKSQDKSPQRRQRRSGKSASHTSSVSQSNDSAQSYSSSPCQTMAPAMDMCNKQKGEASTESSPSSRYRVTPCPTDGACSSRESDYSYRGSRRSRRRSSPCMACLGCDMARENLRDHQRSGNYSHSNASIARSHSGHRSREGRHSYEKSRSPIQSYYGSHHGSRHRYRRRTHSSSTHRPRRHQRRTSHHSSPRRAKHAKRSSQTRRHNDTKASRSASDTQGNEQKSFIDRFSPSWSKRNKSPETHSRSGSGKERQDSSTSRSGHPSKKDKKKSGSSLMCTVM